MANVLDTRDETITSSCGPNSDSGMIVRPAKESDVDMIHTALIASMELYRINSGIPEGKLEALFETREQLLDQMDTVPFYVALLPDGTVVGSVRLIAMPIDAIVQDRTDHPVLSHERENQIVGYFSRFSVLPEMHNRGIGARLYQTAEEEAGRLGMPCICLHTALANEAMVDFYLRRGFALWRRDSSRDYERGLFLKLL